MPWLTIKMNKLDQQPRQFIFKEDMEMTRLYDATPTMASDLMNEISKEMMPGYTGVIALVDEMEAAYPEIFKSAITAQAMTMLNQLMLSNTGGTPTLEFAKNMLAPVAIALKLIEKANSTSDLP